eukprot:3925142-Rhodomonas_salina.1
MDQLTTGKRSEEEEVWRAGQVSQRVCVVGQQVCKWVRQHVACLFGSASVGLSAERGMYWRYMSICFAYMRICFAYMRICFALEEQGAAGEVLTRVWDCYQGMDTGREGEKERPARLGEDLYSSRERGRESLHTPRGEGERTPRGIEGREREEEREQAVARAKARERVREQEKERREIERARELGNAVQVSTTTSISASTESTDAAARARGEPDHDARELEGWWESKRGMVEASMAGVMQG